MAKKIYLWPIISQHRQHPTASYRAQLYGFQTNFYCVEQAVWINCIYTIYHFKKIWLFFCIDKNDNDEKNASVLNLKLNLLNLLLNLIVSKAPTSLSLRESISKVEI